MRFGGITRGARPLPLVNSRIGDAEGLGIDEQQPAGVREGPHPDSLGVEPQSLGSDPGRALLAAALG
jgi:hypothetical protein